MTANTSILSNWSVLIDDFDTSGQDFFKRVEEHVQARKIPQITIERTLFKESGVFSDKREYLRIRRDNLIFDVGAAPFGTGFFFSWWLVRSQARYPWLYFVGYIAVIVVVYAVFVEDLGPVIAAAIALPSVTILLGMMGREGYLGPPEHIAESPVVGWIFRRFFTPPTYHALDIVAMYQESIRRAVNEAIDETLKQQGKQALSPEQKALTSSWQLAITSKK